MVQLIDKQDKYISYYGKAEEEIINGNIDKNLWSLALVKSKGDENMRKSVLNYVRNSCIRIYLKYSRQLT